MRVRLAVIVVAILPVFGLALFGQDSQTPSGSLPAATGAISGTVKHAATGRPIPGAIVALRFGPGTQPAQLLARIRRQLTDAFGRFVFRDLPAGTGYTIASGRVGFVAGAYGQSTTFGPTGAITLTAGQWFNQADILMWKPGAISGRVVDEHSDPVVGVFVRVLAQQFVAGTVKLLAGSSVKTDDRGEYRIAGLVPGRYLVAVPSVQNTVPSDMAPGALGRETSPSQALERRLMGFPFTSPRVDAALDLDPSNRLIVGNFPTPPPVNGRPQTYPMTLFPGAGAVAAATAIDLGLSEERHGVDITLQPVAAVRLSGVVDGPPDQVAGLLLRLMPAGLEELANGSEAATTFVGADGRFVFLNVPAGTYTIDARRSTTELTFQSGANDTPMPGPPGATNGSSQSGDIKSGPPGSGYLTLDGGTPDRYWGRTIVTVGAGDVANLVVPLHRSVMLSGRMVFEGTTRAIVMSQQGGGMAVGNAPPTIVSGTTAAPMRLPTVYAEPANADASLGVPRSIADSNSSVADAFVMDGLRSGEYVLRVNQGSGAYVVKSITVAGADVTYKSIDTTPLRNIIDVVVTYTDQISTITGFVQGDPAAVSNAAVLAFPVERDQWSRYGFTPTRIQAVPMEAATGYRIQGLPAGEYFLVAVDRSQITAWQDPKFLERAAAGATRVKIGWGDTQSVTLKFAVLK